MARYNKHYNEDEINRARNHALHSAQNCITCGKVFLAKDSSKYCEACGKEVGVSDEIHILKDYIQSNPGADVFSVSKSTGISPSTIMRHIKEGRINTR